MQTLSLNSFSGDWMEVAAEYVRQRRAGRESSRGT